MMGKTPDNIETIRPLRDGVIADIDVAEQMIKYFIQKAHGGPSRLPRRPEIVICVPSRSTTVERRAIRDARSEEHTSELQSLMRISYAVFCLKKQTQHNNLHDINKPPQQSDSSNNKLIYTYMP